MARKLGIIQFIKKVKQGDIASIRYNIRRYGLPKGGNVMTDYTALQTALRYSEFEIAKLLISVGCRISPCESDSGLSPLAIAVECENAEIVKMLLERKAEITYRNEFHGGTNTTTVLHFAVEKQLLNMLQLILDCNVNINTPDSSGNTALQSIILRFNRTLNCPSLISTDIEIIKYLLSKGAVIDFQNTNGVYPLHFAAQLNDTEILQNFVRACPDVNATDARGNTVLHILVSTTNISNKSKINITDLVKMLIKTGARSNVANSCSEKFLIEFRLLLSLGIVIDKKNSAGKTPLHLAAENRQDQILLLLLPYTNNVNVKDNMGNSLLHSYLQSIIDHGTTSCENNLAIVQILMKKGAAVDVKNEQDIAPVHLALELGDRDIMMELLGRIDNADICNAAGRSLLHLLAAKRYKSRSTSDSPNKSQESVEFAKKMLAKNATIDLRDVQQRTPLHFAVICRQADMVQLLLEHGADPNAVDEHGYNTLKFLVCYVSDYQAVDMDVSIATMLIANGANGEVVSNQNKSLLHRAAYQQDLKLMQELLGCCSKKVVALKDHQGNTVLHTLIRYNHPGYENRVVPHLCVDMTVKLLTIAGDMLVNEPNATGETPLHLAVEKKSVEFLQVLLLNGADPFICDGMGNTVLHSLASSQSCQGMNQNNVDEQIVEILVKKGCLINAMNQLGWTPLHVAVKHGNDKVVAALVASGAEVHRTAGEDLSTALHLSAKSNNIEVANTLLRNGSDVNATQADGKTCLHLAAKHKRLDMIRILLENRADPDVQDSYGNTALHIACTLSFEPAYKLLLEYGADINIVNSNGSTALLLNDDNQLLYHALKLRAANLLALKNSEYIKTRIAISRLSDASIYDKELLEMERYPINARTSVADVLRMPASRLVIYKANDRFRQLIFESEEFAQKFPQYVGMIRANYRKGIVRNELECSAKKALNVLCRFIWPDICCEKILKNLNNEQLRRLIKAGKLKEHNKKRFLQTLDDEFSRPAKRVRRISV